MNIHGKFIPLIIIPSAVIRFSLPRGTIPSNYGRWIVPRRWERSKSMLIVFIHLFGILVTPMFLPRLPGIVLSEFGMFVNQVQFLIQFI